MDGKKLCSDTYRSQDQVRSPIVAWGNRILNIFCAQFDWNSENQIVPFFKTPPVSQSSELYAGVAKLVYYVITKDHCRLYWYINGDYNAQRQICQTASDGLLCSDWHWLRGLKIHKRVYSSSTPFHFILQWLSLLLIATMQLPIKALFNIQNSIKECFMWHRQGQRAQR